MPEQTGYETDDGTSPEPKPMTADKAFTASGGLKLGGIPLQPWTPARVVAAQAMRLHYGFVDDAGEKQFRQTKVYPGMLRDIAIVLWLCTRYTERSYRKDGRSDTGEVVRIDDLFSLDQAAREPVAAAGEAMEWASQQGILNEGEDKFWEAWGLFWKIMDPVEASRTQPDPGTGKKKVRVKPKRR